MPDVTARVISAALTAYPPRVMQDQVDWFLKRFGTHASVEDGVFYDGAVMAGWKITQGGKFYPVGWQLSAIYLAHHLHVSLPFKLQERKVHRVELYLIPLLENVIAAAELVPIQARDFEDTWLNRVLMQGLIKDDAEYNSFMDILQSDYLRIHCAI